MDLPKSQRNTTVFVLKGLSFILGAWFIGSGMTKLLGIESQVQNFQNWGYPDWFRILTGLLEVTAALLLIASILVGRLATIGALLLVCIMVGATYTRIVNNEPASTIVLPILLLALALLVAWFRRKEFLARS
jgi:putative oxidoreductase